MSAGSKGIYHWKLGDVALAKVSQKTYARVRVVKDEKGLFYDDKVLGISGNEDGSITVTKELCYYVETCRTNHKFWLPYTSLHLAERSRPFYGTEKVSPNKVKTEVSKTPSMPRKRRIKEEHVVPLEVKLTKYQDLNTAYETTHAPNVPLKQGRLENAFKEFVRRGKENIFDQYFEFLKCNVDENKDALDYLMNVDASTEDKFELAIKSVMTEKEIENYLHSCWRYNFMQKQSAMESGREMADGTNTKSPPAEAVGVHISWCLVCGQGDRLRDCINCPAAYHLPCRKEWLLKLIHRKNPPKKPSKPVTLVEKILSSTRTKCTVHKDKENFDICPSCMWGPKVGYDDIVWHKLGPCPWWPARILTPGEVPSCLLTRSHAPRDWPLRYYVMWSNCCQPCYSADYEY